MNWTGGRLQRHSAGNRNAVAQRQKQHFSKIQQKLRGPRKESPIKFSIFDHVVENRERVRGSPAVESAVPQHRETSQPAPRRQGSLINVSQTSHIPQPSNTKGSRDQDPAPVQRPPSRVSEGNIYDATPPPASRVKARKLQSALPKIDPGCYEMKEESMSAKRRRLLRKRDWVGTSIQKPVGIKFAPAALEDNVGRRRKITDGHRAIYRSRQTHILSPFADKRRWVLSPIRGNVAESRADVRIFIGGKVVPPGISSSSIGKSRSRSVVNHQRSHTSHTESSDVMLLDDAGVAEIEADRRRHSKRGHRSRTCPERPLTPYNGVHLAQITSTQSISDSMPSSTQQSRFSFRSGEFEHPRPQRISTLPNLSPGASDSIIAQVGVRKPVIEPSQMLQNDIWASWIAPTSEHDERMVHENTLGAQTQSERVSISPGISTAFHNQQPNEGISEDLDTSEEEHSNAAEPSQRFGSEASYLSAFRTQHPDDEIREEVENDRPGVIVETFKRKSPFNPFRFIAAAASKVAATKSVSKARPEVDEDATWRKFVFGGSSEDRPEDNLDLDAAEPTTKSLENPTCASMVGVAGTELFPGPPHIQSTTASRSSPRSWSMSDDIPRVTQCISMKSKIHNQRNIDDDGKTSVYVANGSVTDSDWAQASLVAQAEFTYPSTPSQRTEQTTTSSWKRVIFTRPKAFVGRKANQFVVDEKPLHIGRCLRAEALERNSSKNRGKKKDIYEIPEDDI